MTSHIFVQFCVAALTALDFYMVVTLVMRSNVDKYQNYRGELNDILNAVDECEIAALTFFVNFMVSGGGTLPL